MPRTQRADPQQRVNASAASSRESSFRIGLDSRESVTDIAPNAETAHTTIRIDAQSHVAGRQASEQLASEEVPRVRRELGLAEQRLPSGAFDQVRWSRTWGVNHLDRATIWEVAFEVVGV